MAKSLCKAKEVPRLSAFSWSTLADTLTAMITMTNPFPLILNPPNTKQ